MRKKDYEIIEHTADIGIRVSAPDLAGVFSKAASAMFDIIAKERAVGIGYALFAKKSRKIELKGENIEELFVAWLNELLSLSVTKESIFYRFKINKLDEKELEAEVLAKPMKSFKLNTEIKAATYHELKIKKVDSGWQAEVIFDV